MNHVFFNYIEKNLFNKTFVKVHKCKLCKLYILNLKRVEIKYYSNYSPFL